MKVIIVFFQDPTREIVTVGPLDTESATLLEAERLEKMFDAVDPGCIKSIVWKDLARPGGLIGVK